MRQAATRLLRTYRTTAAIALALSVAYSLPQAQSATKKALSLEDYTKWRTITGQALSGDGKWVAYVLQLTNTVPTDAKPVLHVKNLDSDDEVTVPHATGGTFSPDSKWLAYEVDPGASQRGRGRGRGGAATTLPAEGPPPPSTPPADPPATPPTPPTAPAQPGTQPDAPAGRGAGTPPIPPRRAELRNLETGTVQSWQDIGSFTFNATSTHLLLRRRAPDAPGAGGGRAGGGTPATPGPGAPGAGGGRDGDTPSGPRGLDAILVDLRTGRHLLLGSVSDAAFNRKGDLLAYTVDATVKDGNGLFVFDTRTGRATPLDNDAKSYIRLTWNDEGTAIAALKGLDVEKMREKNNVLIAFTDVRSALAGEMTDGEAPPPPPAAIVLDPDKADGFPKGMDRQRPRGARME